VPVRPTSDFRLIWGGRATAGSWSGGASPHDELNAPVPDDSRTRRAAKGGSTTRSSSDSSGFKQTATDYRPGTAATARRVQSAFRWRTPAFGGPVLAPSSDTRGVVPGPGTLWELGFVTRLLRTRSTCRATLGRLTPIEYETIMTQLATRAA